MPDEPRTPPPPRLQALSQRAAEPTASQQLEKREGQRQLDGRRTRSGRARSDARGAAGRALAQGIGADGECARFVADFGQMGVDVVDGDGDTAGRRRAPGAEEKKSVLV